MAELTHPSAAGNPLPAAGAEPPRTNRLGKYRITARLGQGGMGVVYAAEDTLLKRQVAIKVLPRFASAESVALRRFLLEARAAAQLNHPNVVKVFEVDEHDSAYFIVMELVRGGSVQDQLTARGSLPWPEATAVLADACRGLAAAHAAASFIATSSRRT